MPLFMKKTPSTIKKKKILFGIKEATKLFLQQQWLRMTFLKKLIELL